MSDAGFSDAAGGFIKTGGRPTYFLLLLHASVRAFTLTKSCSDLGRVLVLNDPPTLTLSQAKSYIDIGRVFVLSDPSTRRRRWSAASVAGRQHSTQVE